MMDEIDRCIIRAIRTSFFCCCCFFFLSVLFFSLFDFVSLHFSLSLKTLVVIPICINYKRDFIYCIFFSSRLSKRGATGGGERHSKGPQEPAGMSNWNVTIKASKNETKKKIETGQHGQRTERNRKHFLFKCNDDWAPGRNGSATSWITRRVSSNRNASKQAQQAPWRVNRKSRFLAARFVFTAIHYDSSRP